MFRLLLIASACFAAEPAPRTIVALGDSLTFGQGVARRQSWPALLQRRLDKEGVGWRVVNAGVSGDTTAGALRRLGSVLGLKPAIVILALGANDGLRGLPLDEMEKNLARTIEGLRKAGARVVLAGVKLPQNYGENYRMRFEAVFERLAEKYELPFIPFLLEGVATKPELNLDDGIHPNAKGYKRVADTVWKTLKPLLESPSALGGSPR